VAGHTLIYQAHGHYDNYGAIRDEFAILRMGDETFQPSRVFYSGLGGQAVSRVAIRSTALEDVYVVLTDLSPDHATVHVFVNPLVTWIWAGAAILVLGILLGNLGGTGTAPAPARAAAQVPVPAR
jgi:cytochrome c biogenesis factor